MQGKEGNEGNDGNHILLCFSFAHWTATVT